MNTDNSVENDWTDEDAIVAQALANYLQTDVAGYQPTSGIRPEPDDKKTIPYIPDLDAEIFRSNIRMMYIVVLSGLIHGGDDQRRIILASVQADRFHDKSFPKFLFEKIAQQFQEKGNISVQELQAITPEHTKADYGAISTRRELFGHYYIWAQILRLRPTWVQIMKAIEIVNGLVKS
jgi:hypothetical protein